MKKQKIMLLLEIILFIMIVGTIVSYAAGSNPPSNGVRYSNSNTSATTVKGALDDLYEKMGKMGPNTNDATAIAGDILSGKTAYVKGQKVTGSMKEQVALTDALSLGYNTAKKNMYVRIPEGAYLQKATTSNKPEIVVGGSSLGNATPSQVLKGATFTSENGVKITGTYDGGSSEQYKIKNISKTKATITKYYKALKKGTWTSLSYNKWTSSSGVSDVQDSIFSIDIGIDSSKIVGGELKLTGNYSSTSTSSVDNDFRINPSNNQKYMEVIPVGYLKELCLDRGDTYGSSYDCVYFYKSDNKVGIRFHSDDNDTSSFTVTSTFQTRADEFYLEGYVVYKE